MRTASVILGSLGCCALLLVIDAVTTRVLSRPQGFGAGVAVGVLFWLGLGVTILATICCGLQLIRQRKAPWRTLPFIGSVAVLLGYGCAWFFRIRSL